VKGRPIACALLACLIDARGQAVPADVFYRTVWRAGEYHPLRHRNMLYVAIKRLRQILAELCPGHGGELIETVPSGWRLVTGVAERQTT
jgi:DNA-binding winged helix-turn-helix (wHTH) protein